MKSLVYLVLFAFIPVIGLSQTNYALNLGLSSPIGEYKALNKKLTSGNATNGINTSLAVEQNIYKGFGIKGMFSFSINPKQEDKIKESYQEGSETIYLVSTSPYKAYSPYLGLYYTKTIRNKFDLGIYAMFGYTIVQNMNSSVQGSNNITGEIDQYFVFENYGRASGYNVGGFMGYKISQSFILGIDISYMYSRTSFHDITYLGNEPDYKRDSDIMRYQVINYNLCLKYTLLCEE